MSRLASDVPGLSLRKPEPATYRHVLADLELPAERVAFFDDNPECVVGAQKAGMRAFHCVGVAPLIASLQELGFALQECDGAQQAHTADARSRYASESKE